MVAPFCDLTDINMPVSLIAGSSSAVICHVDSYQR